MKKNRSDAVTQQTIHHSKFFPYSLEISVILSIIDEILNLETGVVQQKIYKGCVSGISFVQWIQNNTNLNKNEEEEERIKSIKKFSQSF